MRYAVLGVFLFLCSGCWLLAQSPAPTSSPPPSPGDHSTADTQVSILHAAWMSEHHPDTRRALADQLVEAVIHDFSHQQPELVDEVARDGVPKNEIQAPPDVKVVRLNLLTVLDQAHFNEDYPQTPVFRRMTVNRFEAWTSHEGWLFDPKGRLLANVIVPRRDGQGRDWLGAFLSDGTWITTDLWEDDKQLNCFSSTGKWKWELPGATMLSQLSKLGPNGDASDELTNPSVGWARSDRTGRRWLVCLGRDYTRDYALVDPHATVRPVWSSKGPWNEWSDVYPRAMGVRGTYTSLFITSDDNKVTLHRNEAGHGSEVGWPQYGLSNTNQETVIPEGNDQFGFWPQSHDIYIETGWSYDPPPHHLWFFGGDGKYQGEFTGSRLGDAANGRDLLVVDPDNQVLKIASGRNGLVALSARRFIWPDGSRAVPIVLYDDLRLGFFLRGSGMEGFTDDARRARAAAEIALAQW